MNILRNAILKDDYESFCSHYIYCIKKYSYFFVMISEFKNMEPKKALKYVEFMLYNSPDSYSVSYIDYLIENDFSNNLIRLFVEVFNKNAVTPQSVPAVVSEVILSDYITMLINKKEDGNLFDYLMDNPVKDWSNYSNHQTLFNHFVMHDYKYSLDRFYSKKCNPQYYFIDFFNSASTSEIEKKDYPHFEKLKIKNPQLLMSIIASQSKAFYYNTPIVEPIKTVRSDMLIMKSRPPIQSNAEKIWLRYILESELEEVNKSKSKVSKI